MKPRFKIGDRVICNKKIGCDLRHCTWHDKSTCIHDPDNHNIVVILDNGERCINTHLRLGEIETFRYSVSVNGKYNGIFAAQEYYLKLVDIFTIIKDKYLKEDKDVQG